LLEVETQLLIARNLRYLSQRGYDGLMEKSGEVSRMLHGLIQSLGEETSD
jgi:four helix bundle protein